MTLGVFHERRCKSPKYWWTLGFPLGYVRGVCPELVESSRCRGVVCRCTASKGLFGRVLTCCRRGPSAPDRLVCFCCSGAPRANLLCRADPEHPGRHRAVSPGFHILDLLLSFGFDKLAGPAYVPTAWTPFEPSKTVANPRGKGRQSRSSRSCSPGFSSGRGHGGRCPDACLCPFIEGLGRLQG